MSIILTVLRYDLRRFLRDWLMVTFSVAVLLLYVGVVTLVPDDIAPTWEIAVTEPGAPLIEALLDGELGEDAELRLHTFPTEAELRRAFEEGADFFVGIALDDDAGAALARGERPKARIYVDETAPPEVQETARAIGAMMAVSALLPSQGERQEVERLGPAVEEADFRSRTRALMALIILMMEMLALASLLSREIGSGVFHAILTTPVSLPRLFAAKLLFGVLLAFVQAAVVAALVGGLSTAPVLITLHLLIGAVLFTAMGVIAGTRGRHLMEVLLWGMLFMFPSLVPAVAAMLPGTPPLLVQIIPSYPLIQGVLTAGQASPLVEPWVYLAWSAAWAAGLIALAYVALRRRVR